MKFVVTLVVYLIKSLRKKEEMDRHHGKGKKRSDEKELIERGIFPLQVSASYVPVNFIYFFCPNNNENDFFFSGNYESHTVLDK